MGFDATDRDSVLRHAQRLVGRTAQDIALLASDAGLPWDPNTSKGSAGLLIERYFGITPNMDAGPDLASAGIEIKSVPMRRSGRGIRAKERTSITMIDYHRIVTEPFEGTGLDRKTRLTLYVFFLWSDGSIARGEDQEVLRVLLHDRDGLDVIALTDAYDHVQRTTIDGRAHLLSEGDTTPVGACTKGAKGHTRTQPRSDVRARPRAFAWRPAYTTRLFAAPEKVTERLPEVSTREELTARVEQRLFPVIGRSVAELRERFAPSVSPSAKNVAAATFRRMLTGGDEDLMAALETLGTTLRVTRVDPGTLRPREAVSFSPFDFLDVAATPWEESDVLATLGRILFVVLDAPKGATVLEARLRTVLMWSADTAAIGAMEREYEAYRRAFSELPPSEWPRPSATEVLHVRPHGRDGRDVVPLPGGGSHVRSSLWLNQEFVQDIFTRRDG